ncbi:MAG: hypothetical protein QNJ33_02510 [Crocosphaera sp.]|nr:hypothetical protein [Crocosphaera sp.]
MNCCDTTNPLIRDGVSQSQRPLTALWPDTVKVDETDLADFLVFAYRLSQQIIYYPATGEATDNQPQGNWQNFFAKSVSVQLALISKIPYQSVRRCYQQQLITFLDNPIPPHLAPILLNAIAIFQDIQQWYGGLRVYPPFSSLIKGLVRSNLEQPLLRLWGFDQFYHLATEKRLSSNAFYEGFLRTFNLPLPENPELLLTTPEAQNDLDELFSPLLQNYRYLIKQAPTHLLDSLNSRRDHPPHLALYLGFWAVLKPAQDDLNRITQRHLDFFYRDVLGFPEKPIEPDQAHLIFELAKSQQPDYLVEKGTTFKAGKDDLGVELIYQLDDDLILHKAQVTSLKGLFLDLGKNFENQPVNLLGLYSSPIPNSLDGKGTEFPKDQKVKAWLPFGDNSRSLVNLGIAIASPLLLLAEGNRTIILELNLQQQLPRGLSGEEEIKALKSVFLRFMNDSEIQLEQLFQIRLSGSKNWINGSILSVAKIGDNGLTITVEVGQDQPEIVPYEDSLSPPSLPQLNTPVLLLETNPNYSHNSEKLSPYHFLRFLIITELKLTVNVTGIRNVVVQNDQTILDGTKPFEPFGFQPKIGSNFYIGSPEVFQKPLTELEIKIKLEEKQPTWTELYAAYGVKSSFNPGQIKIEALIKKEWKTLEIEPNEFNIFNSPILLNQSQLTNLKLDQTIDNSLQIDETFTPQTQNGFIRLQLIGDSFLHDQYTTVLARQVLATATTEIITNKKALPPEVRENIDLPQRKAVQGAYYKIKNNDAYQATTYYIEPNAEPLTANEPYTPVITELSLDYKAETQYIPTTDNNNNSDIQLLHLHPFDGFNPISNHDPLYLLPTFQDEGNLYIGIENLNPSTSLPLLIQVAEETANTELKEATVNWFYLSDNTWQPFEKHQIVRDDTNGLITSGIVLLAIPPTISKDNTILDPNLYWIKIAVKERSRAICNIIDIHTQAGLVTFKDQNNDPNHLSKPLAAGAIAKPVTPDSALKKVQQPYDSFGGQAKESPRHYYRRISEYLRHKGRAVTIFDYERLVLERYPQIYKVRCINHSRTYQSTSPQEEDELTLQEFVPGSITLAVVPDLSQRNTTNDLQPKVNINLLQEIKQYVNQLSSDWVDIHVVNPRYEAINVEFRVQFTSPQDSNFEYYARELQRGIIQFLSPWLVNEAADIQFGGKVYRSSILNFVEEQSYVDYVINFQMHQGNNRNLKEVSASSARSILVSVPFSEDTSNPNRHIIQPITTHTVNQPIETGLGYHPLNELTLE